MEVVKAPEKEGEVSTLDTWVRKLKDSAAPPTKDDWVFHIMASFFHSQTSSSPCTTWTGEELLEAYSSSPDSVEFYLPQLCTGLVEQQANQKRKGGGCDEAAAEGEGEVYYRFLQLCSEDLRLAHRCHWYFLAFYSQEVPEGAPASAVAPVQHWRSIGNKLQERGMEAAAAFGNMLSLDHSVAAVAEVVAAAVAPIEVVAAEAPAPAAASPPPPPPAAAAAAAAVGDTAAGSEVKVRGRASASPPAPPVAAAAPQHYSASMYFFEALASLSEGLTEVSLEERPLQLKEGLSKLNEFFLSDDSSSSRLVYVPLLGDFLLVRHIHVEESVLFRTNERVPFLVCLEVETVPMSQLVPLRSEEEGHVFPQEGRGFRTFLDTISNAATVSSSLSLSGSGSDFGSGSDSGPRSTVVAEEGEGGGREGESGSSGSGSISSGNGRGTSGSSRPWRGPAESSPTGPNSNGEEEGDSQVPPQSEMQVLMGQWANEEPSPSPAPSPAPAPSSAPAPAPAFDLAGLGPSRSSSPSDEGGGESESDGMESNGHDSKGSASKSTVERREGGDSTEEDSDGSVSSSSSSSAAAAAAVTAVELHKSVVVVGVEAEAAAAGAAETEMGAESQLADESELDSSFVMVEPVDTEPPSAVIFKERWADKEARILSRAASQQQQLVIQQEEEGRGRGEVEDEEQKEEEEREEAVGGEVGRGMEKGAQGRERGCGSGSGSGADRPQRGRRRLVPLIVKANDDLRQEQLMSQLLRQFERIYRDGHVPVYVFPYEILALSPTAGVLEAVPDTVSLHTLRRNWPRSSGGLPAFFARHFPPGEAFERARHRFLGSSAAYAVICYLLQIKDRHNGNILIHADGYLIHIDFGYVLGLSPGGGWRFERAPFKLTREMMSVMGPGGVGSPVFQSFRTLCVRAFLEARRSSEKIITLVQMAAQACPGLPCFMGNPSRTLQDLRARFLLEKSTRQCIQFVNEMIDESVDNWTTRWYDKYQTKFVLG